ncbi:hypothetical protein K443DRAFT_103479 [Laccaria amethystina LaAM-08-1]|uniref:Uncharacterized protein n=1 Tax=Laccaria amethystina LaAM-08-1 TaxID=1095629 RepID=A0A0C9XMC1_9AGAR|nr:hypothetical protein K443DRAFT_103479 [Laccaria amethystina LaAM-08-1]
MFPRHTTVTLFPSISLRFSPLIGMYSDHNIFKPGIEVLSKTYFSNSIDMSILTDILSVSGAGD